MKGQKGLPAYTTKISFISCMALAGMLAVFLGCVIFSTNRLMKQIDLISTQSFRVVGATGDLSTNIARMRIQTERLMYDNTVETVETVRTELDLLSLSAQDALDRITDQNLASTRDLEQLQDTLTKIQRKQIDLLTYAAQGDRTKTEIYTYSHHMLWEHYDEADGQISQLSKTAQENFLIFYTDAEKIRFTTVISSIAIVCVLLGVLFVYQVLLKQQSREIFHKNQLFDLLSNTIDHVFAIHRSPDPQANYISKNAERILGIPAESLQASPELFLQQIPEEDRPRFQQIFPNIQQSNQAVTFRYIHPATQEVLKLQLQTYQTNGEKRANSQYISVITNQTRLLEVQNELQYALTRAEQASLAKSEFLSRMSHEIRTPMNGVIGMTIIALQNIGNESKVVDCLKKITLSSKHLLVLINDILDMSKIESGKIEIQREKFDFRVFMETLTTVTYGQARNKKIDYETVLVGDIGEFLIGDPLRLNQILMNLLSNALKFTPQGGNIVLRVSVLREDTHTRWLQFSVQDTGCGIAEKNLDKIFHAFEQETASVSRQYGGTGLGLSISKRFAELMGGTISVKSSLGKGSVFTVDIPFGIIEGPAILSKPRFENLKALIVDDDPETCEHAAMLLDKIGVCSDCVDNGYAAVAKVEQAHNLFEDYDVCLVDWKMPYLDGLETTRRIRKIADNKELVIVLITAYDASEIEEEAQAAGANGIISKPLFESTLAAAFENIRRPHRPFRDRNSSNERYDFSGKNILIAEDNELNLEIAAELMRAAQANVETVTNGEEAFLRFSRSAKGYFDLILMDVQMPVMNGYEATQKIRALPREDALQIPIIAMTANAFSEDKEKSLQNGMTDHINKPIDLDEIYEKIKQHLETNCAKNQNWG